MVPIIDGKGGCRPRLLVIVGPTASGKSELALGLAEELDGEIVNADSMQVYRGMDIGSAKPSRADRERVRHHLLDLVAPDEGYTAADFRRDADQAIADIASRGRQVILVGGTGLYVRSLLGGLIESPSGDDVLRRELAAIAATEGNRSLLDRLAEVDPVTAARLHPNDLVRIIRALEVYTITGVPISQRQSDHGFGELRYDYLKLGIFVERAELYRRIDARVDLMLEQGLVDEVSGLLADGYSSELKSMRSIGYKEICAYLAGAYSLDRAVELIKRDSRRYAKRQITWFSREDEIKWVDKRQNFAKILQHAIEFTLL